MEYYPSGLIFRSQSYDMQPYKFGGKKLLSMHGLNQYDSKARMQEFQIPRFTSVDPLCEKYYPVSPYAYCNNNPVNLVDPDGRQSIPLPYVAPFPPMITMEQSKEIGNSMRLLFDGIVDQSKESIGLMSTFLTVQSLYLHSTLSPEYQHQRKRDREGKEALDQQQANVQQSINNNTPNPTPDGGSDPKRKLTPKERFIMGGTATSGIVMNLTNPDPSKDAYDAHLEKANQKTAPKDDVKIRDWDIDKDKVYELKDLKW